MWLERMKGIIFIESLHVCNKFNILCHVDFYGWTQVRFHPLKQRIYKRLRILMLCT